MNEAVRAIAWSPEGLVLIRRERAGEPSYFVFPGGGVEPADRSARSALIRELGEELGLEPTALRLVATLDRRPDGIDKVEHFFECRVSSATEPFTGAEAQEAARGGYAVVTIPDRAALAKLNLLPAKIKERLLTVPGFGYGAAPEDVPD